MAAIDRFISERFANSPRLKLYYETLAHEYIASGLSDAHFVNEIASGKDGCFWSRAWEMVLFRHLSSLGATIRSDDSGPDFQVSLQGIHLAIEAIVPAPTGIPRDWLSELKIGEFRVYSLPHEQILLRWTAALKEKREQLDRFVAANSLGHGVPYVIAVNGCRLSRSPWETGISGMPFAVEAVFPVGPWAVLYDLQEQSFGEAYRSARHMVLNRNRSPVPTDSFLILHTPA